MIGHVLHGLRSVRRFWRKRPFLVLLLVLVAASLGFVIGAYFQATGGIDILELASPRG